jgi:hypothetical protein
MRAPASFSLTALLLSLSTVQAVAQQRASRFDGAWRQVRFEVVSPDSSYVTPPWDGIGVISGRHFSEFWVTSAAQGVRQASVPTTAEQKAARYDGLVAMAGTFVANDTSMMFTYSHAKVPHHIGRTVSRRYRLRGDTLQLFISAPWQKDSTKTVRTTLTFVRER